MQAPEPSESPKSLFVEIYSRGVSMYGIPIWSLLEDLNKTVSFQPAYNFIIHAFLPNAR